MKYLLAGLLGALLGAVYAFCGIPITKAYKDWKYWVAIATISITLSIIFN